jgi:uncharacterized protein
MIKGIKLPTLKLPQIPILESVFDSRVFIGTILSGFLLTIVTLFCFALFGTQPQPDFSKITAQFSPQPQIAEPPSVSAVPSQKTTETDTLAPPPSGAEQNLIEDAVAGLHENTPQGLVPVVRESDGLTAFKAYAAPFTPPTDAKSMLSIVLTDFGLSRRLTSEVLKLPKGITLVLSPYVADPQSLTTSARQDAHEVWLKMPVQTNSNADTGPLTLRVGNSLDENRTRTLRVLARATGYAGIIILGDIAMTPQDVSFSDILSTVGSRGLGLGVFVKDLESLQAAANTNKIPFAGNFFFDISTPTEITAALQNATSIAQSQGKAVVQLPLSPASLAVLESYIPKLNSMNIAIAPLSAYINQK